MTPMRRLALPLAAACALVPLAAAGQTPAGLRQELDQVAAALDRAVRQVSAGTFALSGHTTRAYVLPGVGAVFVLPPRAVPVRRVPGVADRKAARALAEARASLERSLRAERTAERRAQIERSLEAVRQAEMELQRRGRPVGPPDLAGQPGPPLMMPGEEDAVVFRMPSVDELAAEVEAQLAAQADMLRELEWQGRDAGLSLAERYKADVEALHAQSAAFQREAERARQEAERAVRDQLGVAAPRPVAAPVAPSAPAPPAAHPAPPPPPAVLAPPWDFWFEYEEGGEPVDAEQVVERVRAAVIGVLEAQGGRLSRLAPADSVVVAADFVPRAGRASSRTLVLRVRKKDLDDRRAGRLAAEEFQRRVEVTEY